MIRKCKFRIFLLLNLQVLWRFI